ncbi:MAG: TPM domain-containing protein [Candidatus Binatia bacterium]
MTISKEDHDRITAAVRAVEDRSSSEVVCVIASSTAHVTAVPVLIAAIVALGVPWLLMACTAMTVQRILSLQVIAFLGLLIFLSLPKMRVAMMPRRARRVMAHHVAMDQFVSRGLADNKGHRAILIFASLGERYARIIVDDEIATRIPQSHWQAAVDALIEHIRDGRVADGFVAAVDLCGNELAKHFPKIEGRPNKLPDRVYLM